MNSDVIVVFPPSHPEAQSDSEAETDPVSLLVVG